MLSETQDHFLPTNVQATEQIDYEQGVLQDDKIVRILFKKWLGIMTLDVIGRYYVISINSN